MELIRLFHQHLKGRLLELTPHIQVVVGPRQVGKTTAVRAIQSDLKGVYFTADSPTPLAPSVIKEWWEAGLGSQGRLLVIDEIQKIPGWSEVLKALWDTPGHSLRVVVTGSSALQIEKGLRESLAGRFELIRVEHWNFSEAREILGISLESFVGFGCYPGGNVFLAQPERWAEYIRDSIIEPVLGRDLIQLHPIEKPALLRQIFGVALQLPSEIVSLQKIQGQLQDRGAIATLQHYLWLLEQAFLVTGIQKFHTSSFQSRQSSPKLIVHDNALIRASERPAAPTPRRERLGRYFENAVGARFVEAGWNTRYWKDRQLEVDFIVEGPSGERWAIEVKWTLPQENELRGLKHFCKSHPEYKPVVVYFEESETDLPLSIQRMTASDVLSICRRYF